MLRTVRVRAFSLSMLVAAVFVLPPAAAQPPVPSVEDAKQLLREAQAKSREANTLEQYTEVIQMCQRVSAMPLPENLIEYEKTLRSWAHNQRGEAYAEQAAELVRAKKNEAAAKIDAQALQEFETAIELNRNYWKAFHNRGIGRAVNRQLDLAVEDFSRVVELKPDYVHAWFNRGEIHFEQGRFAEAASDYAQAVELAPEDPDFHARRGNAYFRLREFRQALADYDRAVMLAPDDAKVLVSRADTNRKLGRWQAAADDYTQAIKLDTKSGLAYQGAAWLMATCPDSKIRNTDLAMRAAQQALDLLGRKDHRALGSMAAALANGGDFTKAVEMQTEAIGLAPPEEREALEKQLELYRQQQPYREQ